MNPVKENIDSRILRLLGLEDVFDLDYSTYATLLKEKLIEVTRGRRGVPHEEVELLKNEFKRVRTKEGRFAPKAKKVKVDNVTNLGSMRRLLELLIRRRVLPNKGPRKEKSNRIQRRLLIFSQTLKTL